MKVRFEHHRRIRFFSRLRGIATGFLVFGVVALACGVYVAGSSLSFLAGSLVGVGFGAFFLWFLRRTQSLYEGSYLEVDEDGLVVASTGEARAIKWEQVRSAEVIRLGSRLLIKGGEGPPLVFPFSDRMKKLTKNLEGTATPEDLLLEMRKYVKILGDRGPHSREGAGIWKVFDWLCFCLGGFLLVVHMLAGVLMVAPGGRLAQAGLLCIALLGGGLAFRGLVLGRAVTAVGVFRGSAARSMGWFGLGGTLLALLLAFVI